MARRFTLPDLGEGLEEAEIVGWLVNEGDHVVTNQPLVSVETDKAMVEIPSPWSGTIARLFGAKGDLVKVGAPLVEFSEGGEADTGTVVGEVQPSEPQRRDLEPEAGARGLQVLPAVRALARKLDVDLSLVQGGGPGGMITRADVERAARSLTEAGPAEPLKGMRRVMSAAHGAGARSNRSDNGNRRSPDRRLVERRGHNHPLGASYCDGLQSGAVPERLVQLGTGRTTPTQPCRRWYRCRS